jgi:hypothetical protein
MAEVHTHSISFVSLLGAVLVVLKLFGKITISWWWVLLPFYGGFALLLGFLILTGAALFLVALAGAIIGKRGF